MDTFTVFTIQNERKIASYLFDYQVIKKKQSNLITKINLQEQTLFNQDKIIVACKDLNQSYESDLNRINTYNKTLSDDLYMYKEKLNREQESNVRLKRFRNIFLASSATFGGIIAYNIIR
jgi:hypothetical protein